jgi:hypothetical protein
MLLRFFPASLFGKIGAAFVIYVFCYGLLWLLSFFIFKFPFTFSFIYFVSYFFYEYFIFSLFFILNSVYVVAKIILLLLEFFELIQKIVQI